MCQILVQTALEELDMARNLAPMTPLSTQIYVVNLIIVPKIVFIIIRTIANASMYI